MSRHRASAGTTGIGCFVSIAIILSLPACASRPSASSASAALVGQWENLDDQPGRAGSVAGAVIETVGIHKPPWAASLAFEGDGHFEAVYPPAELRRLRNKLGDLSLESPVRGTWRVKRDFAGLLWIEMEPGPGSRRLSLKQGKLTLHDVSDYWGAERFRRR